MSNRKKLQPNRSAKSHYGHRLRKYRDRQGWSQPQLGEKACCTGDLISKIETGVNMATVHMSRRFDELFGLAEEFEELQPLAAQDVIPLRFRPYTEFERQATTVRISDPLHVPGLLQTEATARAILSSRLDGDDLDQAVAARMSRQSILTRERPAYLIVLVSEWAVRRPVGDPEIKREQLQHLLEAARRRNIRIQVVPAAASDYSPGAFSLFSFEDEKDVGYVESVENFGRPIDKHSEVEELKLEFDLIRSSALTAEDSIALIQAILERHLSPMDLSSATWRKSSYSGHDGGQCVELADLDSAIGIRDSKSPEGPALVFSRRELGALIARVKSGDDLA